MHALITRRAVLAAVLPLVAAGLVALPSTPATASQPADPGPARTLPSAVPSKITPSVDNGQVSSIAQVGSTMVIGGTFSSVNSQARSRVASFNKTTGALSSFAPTVDNTVNSVIPGPTANTVVIGGTFTHVNGQAAQFLALLDLSTGALVPGFTPPKFNFGYINDLVLRGNRLYVAGTFTAVGGKAHGGLASLNATTGALDPFLTVQLTGHHNDSGSGAQGWVGPWDIDVTQDGKVMAVIGNFKFADGVPHDQVVLIDLSGSTATVAAWNTTRFAPYCFNWAFDSYVRGVAFSPDGSYFIVNATGGGNPGTLCDSTSRFETDLSNSTAQPTWVDETGGDTVWGVAVTNTAVYIGGHNRWNNNPLGVDHAQPGAVPRPGGAALDPISGRPFAWNPGKNPLGAATYAVLPTADGLWIGYDTKWIGNFKYLRPRIAFFPYAGGYRPPSTSTAALPATAFLGSSARGGTSTLSTVAFNGSTATASTASTQGVDFANWHGAFMVGNRVFYAYSDGYFYYRTFDGTTFGAAVKVDPYHDPVWDGVDTNDGTTFDGVFPSIYGKISSITGMTYNQGRLYYTLSGDSHLYSRWFNPDAGIIDETTIASTSSIDFSRADGMFVSGGSLYFVNGQDDSLYSVAFSNGTVSGSATRLSGPSVDGVDWSNRALFLSAANQPPQASFTANCNKLACTFDGSASTDADGSVVSYAWNFGDSGTASGATASHTFAAGGTYNVTLTVTDDQGATGAVTHPVTATAPASGIGFVGSAHSAGGSVKSIGATIPSSAAAGETALLFLTQQTSATWTGPTGVTGWTSVGSFANSTLTTTVWRKTLAAGDPGTKLAFADTAYDHASVNLSVYSGVSAANPIGSVAQSLDTSSANHVTPTVTATSGQWAVSFWADRSQATRTYALPGAVTARDVSTDTGSLTIQAAIGDSNGGISAGPYGGLTATTDATTNRSIAWTITLNAA